jgi:hypothetical protein
LEAFLDFPTPVCPEELDGSLIRSIFNKLCGVISRYFRFSFSRGKSV